MHVFSSRNADQNWSVFGCDNHAETFTIATKAERAHARSSLKTSRIGQRMPCPHSRQRMKIKPGSESAAKELRD